MDNIKTNFTEHLFHIVKKNIFNYTHSIETTISKTHFFIFNLFWKVYSLLSLFLKVSDHFFEIFIYSHKQNKTDILNLLKFIFLENRLFNYNLFKI